MTDDINNKITLKKKLYFQDMRHQRKSSGLLKIDLCNEMNSFIAKFKGKYSQRISINNPSLTHDIEDSGRKVPIIYPLLITNFQ